MCDSDASGPFFRPFFILELALLQRGITRPLTPIAQVAKGRLLTMEGRANDGAGGGRHPYI